jgi:hypothetical protein
MVASALGTFVCAPDIRVLVADRMEAGKTIDLSRDVLSFTLGRRTSAISTFTCELNNKYQKYDRKLQRMARVVVWLRRVQWLQVFSGYLDSVPYETTTEGPVSLTASCTLKRLEFTYWDPYTPEAQALLPGQGMSGPSNQYEDGGAARGIFNLLTKVVHWDDKQIHIQKIPQDFITHADRMNQEDRLTVDQAAVEERNRLLGGTGIVAGSVPGSTGAVGDPQPFPGNLPHPLPAAVGKCSWFGGPGGGAYGTMALSGEPGLGPWTDSYFCAMRWSPKAPAPGSAAAYAFWKNQKILVTAVDKPQNRVVVRPADWGPAGSTADNARTGDTGKVIDLSKAAWDILDVGKGEVTIKVVDPSTPTGRVQATTGASVTVLGATATVSQPATTLNVASGVNMTGLTSGCIAMGHWVAAMAAKNNLSYLITSAMRPGAITASGNKSNHSRGTAFDIAGPTRMDVATMDKLYEIFRPFAQRGVFAECIYKHEIYNGQGVKSYFKRTDHFDHIHISTANPTNFLGNSVDLAGVSTVGTGGEPVGQDGAALGGAVSPFTIAWRTLSVQDKESQLLTAERAFINDEKILSTIVTLSKAAMREFQSAPNGDFVAWFPDWFGIWGKTAVMEVRDIELVDFQLQISDGPLTTHVAAAGDTVAPGGGVEFPEWQVSSLVTIERDEVMKLLFGLSTDKSVVGIDSARFLSTFGLRPLRVPLPQISDQRWEFMLALFTFMKQWTLQYKTPVTLTFMPELYPGMRIRLVDHNYEVYVESVTHRGSRSTGFQTTVEVTCPTRNGRLLELDTPIARIDQKVVASIKNDTGNVLAQSNLKVATKTGSRGRIYPI